MFDVGIAMTELFGGIITLFVILDPIGCLPFFIALTGGVTPQQRKKLANRAVAVAISLLLLFAILGDAILLFLGIQIADFEIAGGVLLLIFALRDALSSQPLGMKETSDVIESSKIIEAMAVIPIATPLLAGPGSLTVVMLLSRESWGGVASLGVFISLAAILVDCLIAWLLFRLVDKVTKALGPTVLLIIGKVMDILMAAIAVSFLTAGIITIFAVH
ncbi:MAG: MarC family protein [Nitrososphaerota archaeon]|nr:MarC family protein [Nitrososphaerota archaeon]MDG6923278.1 MarC family protein [Nitrososphaerota archaeon]